jgi:hopanoid biosynthesis associated protein HpnK
MKRLIVNADDFGLTEGVNRAIIESHVSGIVTSTSILANGTAFEPAVAAAKGHPNLSVGVHLNLTEGWPVSVPSKVPSLLNSEEVFVSGALKQAERILRGRASLKEIEEELRSQIQKVKAAGIRITHLDGHQHLHLLPRVLDIVIKLAHEFEISAIRCSRESYVGVLHLMCRNKSSSPAVLQQFLTGRALAVLSSGMKQGLRYAGLSCPNHFFGFTQTGFLDATAIKEILHRLPQGTSELMCHPGYFDADLANMPTRLLGERQEELRALTDPAVKRLVTEAAIELVHYGAVSEA